ncbi:DegT/DnrJ/EryC1/StrS family aminotransferase [Geomonas anaerohicana]|uniref:DegT/DnrJ/EryC1/StrS family aminotransferase n=1 Tax=Geomonas anaerohicana TaxID=2798583 RepID=A0ABS0YBZ9_9BACT|nr:DegT/DnrJ/EryC1/StrS family aminotransferase [Geomonas anaerohicana]MBJ6749818.1 DegT/DnrJ/EryC1/StrS family aminotransferase [Geomonas anaerohicana]
MRIGRTLPPAAAPLSLKEILSGLAALVPGTASQERFQAELREYYRVPHVFLLSSGKAALAVILLALKELTPDRDEVLVPAYTCYSVPAAIIRAGLKVRPCDIDPQTLDFDWDRVEEAMAGGRLLGAVSTHLFGLPADVERLKQMAAGHGVTVIEDAAQAMGGEVGSRKIGTMGDVALFSLGRGKALCTVSGGIILTGSDELGGAIEGVVRTLPVEGCRETLKNICYALALLVLVRPCFFWLPKAVPFLKLGETIFDARFELKRLGGFQAGLSKGWQEKIVALREARSKSVSAMITAGICGPVVSGPCAANIIKFPVLINDFDARDRLLSQSELQGLGISAVYPGTVSKIPELNGRCVGTEFPHAEYVAKRIVTLPVNPYVTSSDIKRIYELCKRYSA